MMTLMLNDLYRYVFSTASIIDVSKVPEEKKAHALAEKKKAIQEKFKSITEEASLSLSFRGLLRSLDNPNLEDHLYGNHTDILTLEHKFPNDESIRQQFQLLNQEYRYFSDDEKAENNFIALFKACKLTADFVEQNNTENNDIAYLHAYKMLVLFGAGKQNPFSQIENFIKTHGSKFQKPVHDTLVHAIPKNDPPITLPDWQKLISKHGCKIIELFQQAPEIEKILGRAPTDLSEAEITAAKITYSRAGEFPELATLCKRYHVSEKAFNKCLEIKIKQSDKLPDVIIDGATVGQKGYYFVKLPINDPRAFILGHITNCCQSIGGHGEPCVIDGITRENNGFYVLLKEKENISGEQKPLIDGKINYENYDIKGQGYAWLSIEENLTFDSWENLTPSVEDEVIVPMLTEFGRVITEPESSPIIRVTIGTGGKTPPAFKRKHPTTRERMIEGYSYPDSNNQVLVSINQARIDQYNNEINTHFSKIPELKDLNRVNIVSMAQVKKIKELFFNPTNLSQYLKEFGDKYLSYFARPCLFNISTLNVFYLLHKASILSLSNAFTFVTKRLESAPIAGALYSLSRTNIELVNDINFNAIINAKNIYGIANAIILLSSQMPIFLNNSTIKFLADQEEAQYIAVAFGLLYQVDPALANNARLELLATHGKYASSIATVILILKRVDSRLVNDPNLTLLMHHPEDAIHIESALSTLYKANPQLINEENFKLLANYSKNAADIVNILSKLSNLSKCTDLSLANNPNFKLLANHIEYVSHISSILSTLEKSDKVLVNNTNFNLLIDHVKDTQIIDRALNIIDRYAVGAGIDANTGLVNNVNFTFLVNHAAHAENIAHAIYKLHCIHPGLVNDENRAYLITNLKNIDKAADKLIQDWEKKNQTSFDPTSNHWNQRSPKTSSSSSSSWWCFLFCCSNDSAMSETPSSTLNLPRNVK